MKNGYTIEGGVYLVLKSIRLDGRNRFPKTSRL
jgi:hypothetical protein